MKVSKERKQRNKKVTEENPSPLKNKKVKFNIHTGEITSLEPVEAPISHSKAADGKLALGTKVRVTKPIHAYREQEGTVVQILTLLPGYADRAVPVIGYKISFPVKGTPGRNHEFFLASTDFETISS